mmetsp:Transcript_9760/g.13795  ORF Transcript_9760/g.13795 Transcript_9760/m.13795 type:complete len:192 (+) Transcript_9760:30-605(+)
MLHSGSSLNSLLSPLASPYAPPPDDQFKIIYSDGQPVAIHSGMYAGHEVLQNISDDAIDEAFPPNAEDAAELDAVEDFVRFMANISILEEEEEKARNEFNHVGRRWEARREEGLKGKPLPVTGMISKKKHLNNHDLNWNGRKSIVHRDFFLPKNKRNNGEISKKFGRKPATTKSMFQRGRNNPIQQPRKHS